MIPKWEIMALNMGEFILDKSLITYGKDYGKEIRIPIWAFAVYGDKGKILVDTGIQDVKWINENIQPCFQQEDEKIVNALKKGPDWNIKDVNIVINTHLHYDHCGNNGLFKNARIFVQRREWENAFNHVVYQESIYIRHLLDYRAVNMFNWEFIDGEADFLPGIKIIPTPGHTPGGQSVFVNTKEGVACITGDIAHINENIRENIPTFGMNNIADFDSSYKLIRRYTNIILTAHEPSIKKFQNSKFPRLELIK